MQEIRTAKAHEVQALSNMLARAFVTEEFWYWAMQAEHLTVAQQQRQLAQLFKVQIERFSLPYNATYCEQHYKGAALWTPPEQWDLNLWEQLRCFPDFVKIVGWRRLFKVLTVIEQIQKKHPHQPHFYLQIIGVDPRYQNQGWSRKLLEPVLQHCDQHQIGAYLETATPSNVALYHRFGFEIMHCLDQLSYGAPKLYCMWRDPKVIV